MCPDYVCASVVRTISDCGCRVCFYHIDDELYQYEKLFSTDDLKSAKAIILVNYFGMLDLSATIKKVREKAKQIAIIVDDVQNFYGFGLESDYDFAFTSYRKWFPVPDGAKAICNKPPLYLERFDREENLFSGLKVAGNILKNYRPAIKDDLCLELLSRGEKILDKHYRCRVSDISIKLMRKCDLSGFGIARRSNAKKLHEKLKKNKVHHIYREGATPLFVPVFFETKEMRDRVRKKMFENNIFCPVHWPQENIMPKTSNLYDKELSLICDWRYDVDDMNTILEILINAL